MPAPMRGFIGGLVTVFTPPGGMKACLSAASVTGARGLFTALIPAPSTPVIRNDPVTPTGRQLR